VRDLRPAGASASDLSDTTIRDRVDTGTVAAVVGSAGHLAQAALLCFQAVQNRQQFRRVRTLRVIGVHFGVGDDAVGPDYKACWHWQHPGRVVVEDRQIVLEALVELDQILRQREANPEGVGDFAFDITQDREVQLVLALRFAAVRCRLRRDRDQADAARRDIRQRLLQRLQLEITVRIS